MSNYLYNGYEAPPLPELWDRKIYPYALLYKSSGTSNLILDLYAEQPVAYESDPYLKIGVPDGSNALYWGTAGADKSWTEEAYYVYDNESYTGRAVEFLSGNAITTRLIWSNTDIVKADGSVYLVASYPTDAETGEEIHDYEIGGEPEEPEQPETDLTARDLYRKINGKPTKLTLYKKLGGKLIPLDEHTKEVKT